MQVFMILCQWKWGPYFSLSHTRGVLWGGRFAKLCQCWVPVLALPLACCGTSLSWASVSLSVRRRVPWNVHFSLSCLESATKQESSPLGLILKKIAVICGLSGVWWQLLLSVNYEASLGQLERNVLLVTSWTVGAAPLLQP